MVKNLLDCHDGNFCGKGCYAWFVHVWSDLLLMSDGPSCFPDYIPTSPPPSLRICDKLYGIHSKEEATKL